MVDSLDDVLSDLTAEYDRLDEILSGLIQGLAVSGPIAAAALQVLRYYAA